ncbi:MAG TPA: GNAT family protein [Stackebrandtia sp.]|jgi:RimJ/RimL family protein N-acetyltransferase|uniref:GNAT family N-acetyltransferase n=1 Tax=Stackebrandtia sp. TaxID=2023065 RepID=UPI002D2B86A2|nr:GNAT family protein [Stackebrandtia sp.]HZE40341.1 GNAT family protein [Stackebrandtia sp.]
MTDFSIKPTLKGERATLVPMAPEHFPALWKAMNDPEVTRYTGSRGETTEEVARHWTSTRGDTTDRLDLAIVDNATGECVGEAVLNEWEPEDRRCNFRIMIGPDGQGRGLGTDATRLIVGYGFETLGLHRISLGVYAFNPRARRAYEKAGFVREGVERDELLWDGQWVDNIIMSILEDEWRRHRGHPEG